MNQPEKIDSHKVPDRLLVAGEGLWPFAPGDGLSL
jgi:hypothetical protein